MPRSITRSYSSHAKDANLLLANLIKIERKKKHLTLQEVAERVGIARSMLQRIEKGDLKCEIGVVFEVATLLGIRLFELDDRHMRQHLHHTKNQLALLPKAIHKSKKVIDDNF